MKRHFSAIALSFFLYIVGFLVCIYPSFVSRPGIDCFAGCAPGKGFPWAFNITHMSLVISSNQSNFSRYLYIDQLISDYFFVAIVSSIPLIYSINKKKTSTVRAFLYSIGTFILAFLIGLPILFMYISAQAKAGVHIENIPFILVQQPCMCIADVKQCGDGSYVSRTGPNCEFAKCAVEPTQ